MPSFSIPESDQRYVVGNVVASVDRDGAQQVDPSGVLLWEVRVMADATPEPGRDRLPTPEIIRIQVPAAQMPQLQFGQPARFAGLVARTWSARDGRQGIMYQAAGLLTAQPHPQVKGAAPTAETGR
ncbi:hypothetical protein ACFFRE_00185 [Aciditerrimonas ferrireducens]|jgi:hypothetical protein|uniref:Plasmid replication, integration and excision activator n=1 Tax=Aciditerrimonas ferrireducens TaxID=667306 RepID=A0ABV6C154_9ACTN